VSDEPHKEEPDDPAGGHRHHRSKPKTRFEGGAKEAPQTAER
jgi:hypothetical protein